VTTGRPDVRALVAELRWDLRFRAAQHIWYLPIARRRYGDAVIGPATEVVIDGFTRTAVTFSVIAFQAAQERPVRVAHTIHSAAHIREAARRGVPCIVAIREPDQTALSIAIREPHVGVGRALAAYARFYGAVARIRRSVVMADFDEVTANFGEVIDRLNRRFHTGFTPFVHDASNVEEVFSIIEDRSRRPPWSAALGRFEDGKIGLEDYRAAKHRALEEGQVPTLDVPEHRVQRPSEARERRKAELVASLDAPSVERSRRLAWAVYRQLRRSDE
jgi:hypothetical protein